MLFDIAMPSSSHIPEDLRECFFLFRGFVLVLDFSLEWMGVLFCEVRRETRVRFVIAFLCLIDLAYRRRCFLGFGLPVFVIFFVRSSPRSCDDLLKVVVLLVVD